jgi:hypothetical protein
MKINEGKNSKKKFSQRLRGVPPSETYLLNGTKDVNKNFRRSKK